jgi:hypothetical protein
MSSKSTATILAALLLAAGAVSACSGSVVCPDQASPGVAVTVLNASGIRVCDAVVTATDGEYSTRLQAGPRGVSCRYFGAYDRPGDYTVHVRLGYFTKTASNIVVSRPSVDCPVGTQDVTVRFS